MDLVFVVTLCSMMPHMECKETRIPIYSQHEQILPMECFKNGIEELSEWKKEHPNWSLEGKFKCIRTKG